jgi:hypothetical protein
MNFFVVKNHAMKAYYTAALLPLAFLTSAALPEERAFVHNDWRPSSSVGAVQLNYIISFSIYI